MGTWALPKTIEKAVEFKELMDAPILRETATEQLINIFGDDDLFDIIDCMEGNFDVRPIVRYFLADLFIVKKKYRYSMFDPKSLNICNALASPYEKIAIATQVFPKTKEEAEQLDVLMDTPILRETATQQLNEVLNDKGLYHLINELDRNVDIRPIIRHFITDYIATRIDYHNDSYDAEAIDICMKLISPSCIIEIN